MCNLVDTDVHSYEGITILSLFNQNDNMIQKNDLKPRIQGDKVDINWGNALCQDQN